MHNDPLSPLTFQFGITWKLTTAHLETLTTAECLWRPAPNGLHIYQNETGAWQAEWPEHERYELGPSSLAWLTWHLGFWWTMLNNHSFGDGSLTKEAILWPGDADSVREWIYEQKESWVKNLSQLSPADLQANTLTKWPYTDGRPFIEVVAWANIELMKNAAEIGYVRYLYAGQKREAAD